MGGDTYTARERLALTNDGRLVPYEHRDAAFLAYRPGDVIPLVEAQAAGLVDAKEAARPEDKMARPVEDKAVKIPAESKRQPARKPQAGNVRKGSK